MSEIQLSKEAIGFIGLGNLGKPMAKRLVEKGYDITVYDIRKEAVEELNGLGAKVARTVKEVALISDIIIVMVRDTPQAEEVILSEDGVLAGAKHGSLIIITSTVDPVFCQKAAKVASEKGVGLLDAPVSGGSIAVEEGNLTLMVGGEEALLEKCRHVMEAWGKNIFYLGDVGMGQIVKLANNLMTNINLIATFEGIKLATNAGMELNRFLDIIRVSSGNSWAVQKWHFWREVKKDQVNGLAVTYKDIRLALNVAKAFGVDLPLLESVSHLDLSELIE